MRKSRGSHFTLQVIKKPTNPPRIQFIIPFHGLRVNSLISAAVLHLPYITALVAQNGTIPDHRPYSYTQEEEDQRNKVKMNIFWRLLFSQDFHIACHTTIPTSKVLYFMNVRDDERWQERQRKFNLNQNSARNKQKRGYLLILSFKIYRVFSRMKTADTGN